MGGVFLLRQSDLTDLARCVCRSFIRPSVSFVVFFNDGLKSSERSDFRRSFQLDSVRVAMLVYLNFWRQNDKCIILMKSTYLWYI